MTYIERREWCSSSVSTTMHFSTIRNTTEPCPISSSSIVTSSLISTIDYNPISNDSALSPIRSYGERKNTLSLVTRSTCNYSNDYYTNRRIEELHERMDDIQLANFINFINYHLSARHGGKQIQISDLSDGCILIQLIEILSSTKLKYERGSTRFHALNNVKFVIDYLKLRKQHIDISPYEIVSGNRKQTLALIWIIMKTFDFPSFRVTDRNCLLEKTLIGFGQDRSIIVRWLNNILNRGLTAQQIYINNFYIKTWIDGYYLSVIITYLIPLSSKYLTVKCFDYLRELNELKTYDRTRFNLCLTISTYCFDTRTIIDFTDKTEKSLFRYFTELQQNVFSIIKANHIGRLIQNNSYAKQVLDTAIQTRKEHSSNIVANNDLYISSIKDEHQVISRQIHRQSAKEFVGHSSSSSHVINESSSLFIHETTNTSPSKQQETPSVQRVSSQETENLQSNSNVVNTHECTRKDEEHVEAIINESDGLNGIVEKSEQFSLSDKQNEQHIINHVESQSSTVHCERVDLEASEKVNGQKQEMIIKDTNEISESSISDVQDWKEFLTFNDEDRTEVEQTTMSQKDIQESNSNSSYIVVVNQQRSTTESILSTIETKQSIVNVDQQQQQSMILNQYNGQVETNNKQQEQIISSVEQSSQHESSLVTNDQSLHIEEEEEEKQNSTLKEHNEQLLVETKASTITIEDISSMNINKQSIIKVEDTISQQKIESTITFNKVEEFSHEESVKSSNEKVVITNVEHNHTNRNDDELEHSVTMQTTESKSLNGEIKQSTTNISDHENSQQSIVSSEQMNQNKQYIAKDSSTSTYREEVSSVAFETVDISSSNRKLEQTQVKHVDNDHSLVDEKLEQLTSRQSIQDEISNKTTTLISVGNDSSSVISKKLEKPTVMTLPQPMILDQHTDKSTNKKNEYAAVVASSTKKSTQASSSFHEHQRRHVASNNVQSIESNVDLNQSEQIIRSKLKPIKNTGSSTDVSNGQSLVVTNESTKLASSLKNQDNTIEIKKSLISSVVTLEKSEQNIQTNADVEQVILTNTIQRNQQSDISIVKQEVNTTIIQETNATSIVSTGETQFSVQKTNKKTKRSHNKKHKSKKSSIESQHSAKLKISNETASASAAAAAEEEDDEEENKPSSSSTDDPGVSTTQEQYTTNVESEVDSPSSAALEKSSNEDTSAKLEPRQNPSALRSRKNKKKASSTKTSSSHVKSTTVTSTVTTITATKATANRNAFVIITESIQERKILGYACVFILVLFAFVILIISLAHQ